MLAFRKNFANVKILNRSMFNVQVEISLKVKAIHFSVVLARRTLIFGQIKIMILLSHINNFFVYYLFFF